MNPFITSLSLKTYLFDGKSNEPFYSLNNNFKDLTSESFMTEIGLGQIDMINTSIGLVGRQ